jgi:glycosyltransferase involved in cell wall biosynthesis
MTDSAQTAPRRRLVFITNDVIGARMAGPAIRVVELAKRLASEFEVSVVAHQSEPHDAVEFSMLPHRRKAVEAISRSADFVLIQGDLLSKYPFLRTSGAVLIVDLYCPFNLEYLQSSTDVPSALRLQTLRRMNQTLFDQLVFADYFLCASERQRDFWLGSLSMAGRLNHLRWPDSNVSAIPDLLSIIPFGFPQQPPMCQGQGLRKALGIGPHEFVAIWGGGIYDWLDPVTVIRATHALIQQGTPIHVVFMGTRHPNSAIHAHRRVSDCVDTAKALGIYGKFVHLSNNWTPYMERANSLLDADIGISAHFESPESRFAFRTRLLDYLWVGLPIVTTAGCELSSRVAQQGFGITVRPNSVDDWISALRRMASDHHYRQECRAHIAGRTQDLHWEEIASHLCTILSGLGRAPDRLEVRRGITPMRRHAPLLSRVRHAYAEGGVPRVVDRSVQKLFSLWRERQ